MAKITIKTIGSSTSGGCMSNRFVCKPHASVGLELKPKGVKND
jgi:energy-converting hydrogenase Eha subunit B